MIELKVMYYPNGERHRAKEIGYLQISNISDLEDVSDYEYTLHSATSPMTWRGPETHHGIWRGHNRKHESIWSLVRKILEQNKDWL
jgi:hypothetical protein